MLWSGRSLDKHFTFWDWSDHKRGVVGVKCLSFLKTTNFVLGTRNTLIRFWCSLDLNSQFSTSVSESSALPTRVFVHLIIAHADFIGWHGQDVQDRLFVCSITLKNEWSQSVQTWCREWPWDFLEVVWFWGWKVGVRNRI